MSVEVAPPNGMIGSQGDQNENDTDDVNNNNNVLLAEDDVANVVEDSNLTADGDTEAEVKADTDGADDKDDNNNNMTNQDLNDDGRSTDGGSEEVRKNEDDENEKQDNEDGDVYPPEDPAERPASAPSPHNRDGQQASPSAEAEEGGGEGAGGEEIIERPPVDGEEEADGEENPKAQGGKASPTGTTTSTLKVKSAARKHTTTPADDSGLVQPILPAIPRGQVKVQQIASSISDARKKEIIGQPTIYPIRSRVPPKLVRLATVTVSPAKTRPAPHGPSLYYEEPKRPQKVITWDAAHNARPPLRIDMEGPGPCSYSPLNKPLNETNAPSYSFGTKCYPEKPAGVGSRTSWAKSWFQSSHPYHSKADYVREGLWPSPTHYPKTTTLGVRQRTMYQAPSYTFGNKSEFSIVKAGAHKEPSPTDYERQNADGQILRRGPSFSHQFRREGTVLWGCAESNPGPAAYTPAVRQRQQKPSYTIQGIRRSKSHILGPFSSI